MGSAVRQRKIWGQP